MGVLLGLLGKPSPFGVDYCQFAGAMRAEVLRCVAQEQRLDVSDAYRAAMRKQRQAAEKLLAMSEAHERAQDERDRAVQGELV